MTTTIPIMRPSTNPTLTQDLSLYRAAKERELKQKRRAIRRARLHLLYFKILWGIRSLFKVFV